MLHRFIMPQNRSAHSIQQAKIKSKHTQSKPEDHRVRLPINRTMLHQDNQSKFTVTTDHLQWGHDCEFDTQAISDNDEETILFGDKNSTAYTHKRPLLYTSGQNSRIMARTANTERRRPSEPNLAHRRQQKKIGAHKSYGITIDKDQHFIRYPYLSSQHTSYYPRLPCNVRFLLRAMNIDNHLGKILFVLVNEQELWNMLTLDPVELFEVLYVKLMTNSPHKPLVPPAYIIPVVFRMKLFRYHLVKYYQLETTPNGAFLNNISTPYLLSFVDRNIKQDFMVRLVTYELRFTVLLARLDQATSHYFYDDKRNPLPSHHSFLQNTNRIVKGKMKKTLRAPSKFCIQPRYGTQHSLPQHKSNASTYIHHGTKQYRTQKNTSIRYQAYCNCLITQKPCKSYINSYMRGVVLLPATYHQNVWIKHNYISTDYHKFQQESIAHDPLTQDAPSNLQGTLFHASTALLKPVPTNLTNYLKPNDYHYHNPL